MNKFLRFSLFGLGIIVITIAALWVFTFHTGAGRGLIKSQVEQQIAKALGGTAMIGSLEPGLPGLISVKNVVIDEDADSTTPALLLADSLSVRWRPFALLSGKIIIDSIALNDVTLDHLPKADETKTDKPSKPISLPDTLPSVRIDALDLTNITIGQDVAGQAVTLNASGSLAMGARRLKMDLSSQSSEDRDTINITTNIDLATKQFDMDAVIKSTANGLISTLAQSEGKTNLTVKGRQKDQTAIADIKGTLGSYGRVDLAFSGEMRSGSAITLAGKIFPGTQFDTLTAYLGDTIDLSISGTPEGKGAAVEIQKLTAQFGSLSGRTSWKDNSDMTRALAAMFDISLADDLDPTIREWTGKQVHIEADLSRATSDLYDLASSVQTDHAQITLRNARSDLTNMLSGTLQAVIKGDVSSLTQFDKPITLTTNLDARAEQFVKLDALSISAGTSISGSGATTYNLVDETIDANLDATLNAAGLAKFVPDIKANGPTAITLRVNGPIDNFSIDSTVNAPALQVQDSLIPAGTMTARLTGLPTAPDGSIRAKPVTGNGGLALDIRSRGDLIMVRNLSFEGSGFRLAGAVTAAPKTQSVAIDLTYAGAESAVPFPGLPLTGDFQVTGGFGTQKLALNPEAKPLTLDARALSMRDLSIRGLEATVAGSMDSLDITVSAADLLQADQSLVSNLSIATTIDQSDTITATIAKFEGLLLAETKIALTQPTNLVVGDAVIFSDLSLKWGDRGTITGDGGFAPTRWQADLEIDEVIIPHSDGLLSLVFNLDTDNTIPATGTFSTKFIGDFTVTPDNPLASSLDAKFTWDGERLQLSDRRGTSSAPLDFDVSIPAQLVRGDALSVSTEGPIDGTVRYDGPVSTLTAAIPGPAQGLEGLLALAIDLGGTLTEPTLSGTVDLTEAALTDEETGLSLIGLHAHADLSANGENSTVSFSGGARGASQDGADRLMVDGKLLLGERSRIDATINTNDLEVGAGMLTSIRPNSQITLSGTLEEVTVNGAIDIEELNLDIIAAPSTGLVPVEVVAQLPAIDSESPLRNADNEAASDQNEIKTPLNLDLSIVADDRLFVRGLGLDSEWESDIKIETIDALALVLGEINLRRGTFDFSGRRFNVTKGEVIFDQLSQNDPVISLEAEFETNDGLVARVIASGRSSDPKIELTSTPIRPANDVMSLILFGKPAENLTALESIQTAQALASLGGIGPFGGGGDFVGSLRQSAGLDLLNIDLDPENGASALTVGKYVADGLFVSATQDIQGKNGAVRIEYEIRDNITVESNVRQDGDQTVSANWKKDF